MGKQINVGLKFTADTGQAKASIQELQSLLNKLSLDSASTNKAATEAKRLYKKACDGNEFLGCNNLGLLEEDEGNSSEAKRLYKKALCQRRRSRLYQQQSYPSRFIAHDQGKTRRQGLYRKNPHKL